jgi:hypothetical protein
MSTAHHVLGLGYLEIECLTISHVMKLFEINQKGFEVSETPDAISVEEVKQIMQFQEKKSGRR